ncbi:MAG: HAD family hydrolase [Ruminococcaceae bacterium]|nr:HAD family hydrolase [Oscillospiraceae bacterium]
MRYTHIIWDFNGTILDDVETGIKSVNKLLSDRNLPVIPSVESYRKVFGFPIIDYYRKLGFDFDKEPYEVIAPLWVNEYLENVKSAKVFPDVKRTIDLFASRGMVQIVLSATEREMLIKQLNDLGLADRFDDVLGLDNIHAESKVALAKEWFSNVKNAVPVMIGDTTHDVQTADAIGADCILVARGHQSYETLKECCDKVVMDLDEAVKLII